MNLYKFAVFGCCLGILAVILVSNLSNSFTKFMTILHLNKHFKFMTEVHLDNLSAEERLASSVWCRTRVDGTKLCKFKNLYYLPSYRGHLLFLINEFSILSGAETLKQSSLSTVQNHGGVNLKLVMLKSFEYLQNQKFVSLDTDIIILSRFKSDNIMHVIHDDLLPLYITYKELCNGDIPKCLLSYQLLLFDGYDNGPYFNWYLHFSSHDPIVIAHQRKPLCIKGGIFGLSNSSVWFQYGFKNVQGPIINNNVNSFMLDEFIKFIQNKFGLTNKDLSHKRLDTIVFFSRKINRKILNERFLEEKMKEIAQSIQGKNITVVNLDLSTNSSDEIIYSLQKAKLLVGMHGSAMILAVFMPPGSHIIELFPFGIQPEFVSPLRSLCMLPDIYYHYESWVNMNESNTRTHPEYPPLLGGLMQLGKAKQDFIKDIKKVPAVRCCHDPIYLFRMFQDTIVDDSFLMLFRQVISNYSTLDEPNLVQEKRELILKKWYFPPPIFNLTCKCSEGTLSVNWNYPFMFEGTDFSVATSNGILAVMKTTHFSVKSIECVMNAIQSPEESVTVWVKVIEGEKESLDSFVRCTTVDEGGL